MAQNDTQWLAAHASEALETYILTGDSLTLQNFPPHASVIVDGREYSQGLLHVRGLSPRTMHLVSLSLRAPGSHATIFVPPVAGRQAVVRYNDADCTLVSLQRPMPVKLPGIGTRGVAVQTGPARKDWDALAGHICKVALAHALMKPGQGTVTPVFEPWPPAQPPPTPDERTRFGMDKTPFVLGLVAKRCNGRFNALLGELQIAFLSFLYLGIADAETHWVKGIIILCSCIAIFEDAPEARDAFATALAAQLGLISAEVRPFFNGFGLTTALRRFSENFKGNAAQDAIRLWVEDDAASTDEDKPTVVDLNQ